MTTPFRDSVLLTGATGLVGGQVLRRLLAGRPAPHVFAITRAATWKPTRHITPLRGDITAPGLGLPASAAESLRRRVRLVIHCAADTVFSRPLDEARLVNTVGTAHVVELAESLPAGARLVHVSTAFVAGRRTGRIQERGYDASAGFVNGYEQSKHEAEQVVRASAMPWVIVRPSAIVCDGDDGRVSQFNAVHRALKLYHGGLASMMPGAEENLVDMVPAEFVAECVERVSGAPGVEGRTFHACAGDRALPLGELLDRAYDVWSESTEWRRRAIPRPALTDLDTYRLFEGAVEDTGDERLRAITRSLSHFVPQLAMPKVFDTSGIEEVLGCPPPPTSSFWSAMIRFMLRSRWGAVARRAA